MPNIYIVAKYDQVIKVFRYERDAQEYLGKEINAEFVELFHNKFLDTSEQRYRKRIESEWDDEVYEYYSITPATITY